jgi:hypothetical protein
MGDEQWFPTKEEKERNSPSIKEKKADGQVDTRTSRKLADVR